MKNNRSGRESRSSSEAGDNQSDPNGTCQKNSGYRRRLEGRAVPVAQSQLFQALEEATIDEIAMSRWLDQVFRTRTVPAAPKNVNLMSRPLLEYYCCMWPHVIFFSLRRHRSEHCYD